MTQPQSREHWEVLPFLARMVPLGIIILVAPPIAGSSLLEDMSLLLPLLFVLVVVALWMAPNLLRRETDYISFLLGFTAGVLAPASTTNAKFYDVAAQIVPVLFLALGFETRTFQIAPSLPSPRVLTEIFLIVPALALAIAGYESVKVIITQDATRGRFDLVIGALVAAAASLTISAFLGRMGSSDTGLRKV